MNATNSLTTSLKSSKFTHAETSYWTRWSDSSIYWFSNSADAESAREDLAAQGWRVSVVDDGPTREFRHRLIASRERQ